MLVLLLNIDFQMYHQGITERPSTAPSHTFRHQNTDPLVTHNASKLEIAEGDHQAVQTLLNHKIE